MLPALRFVQFLNQSTTTDRLTSRLVAAREEPGDFSAEEIRALDQAVEEARRGEVVAWDDGQRPASRSV